MEDNRAGDVTDAQGARNAGFARLKFGSTYMTDPAKSARSVDVSRPQAFLIAA